MIPPRKDPLSLLSATKDWLEDAEQRLEDGRLKESQLSLQEAILTYSALPAGYSDLELERGLMSFSKKIYNRLA